MTTRTIKVSTVRVGKRYQVEVHGARPVWAKCTARPDCKIMDMKEDDFFLFETASGRQIRLWCHQNKGPKFLVTKIHGITKDEVTTRVTIRERVKNGAEVPAVERKAA